jgi:hypothetical protein
MTHNVSFASLLSVSFVLVIAACESHTPAAPTTPSSASPFAPAAVPGGSLKKAPPIAARDAQGCPMDLPGTRASVVVLDDAVALDLITPGDVMELRRRVHALGDLAVTDVEHGARVTIAVTDASARHELATRVSAAAGDLNRGDCTRLSADWLR